MIKYRATPKISIAVVTKGPVEIAGSKFNFFSISGTLAPTVVAIVIEQAILSPMTKPRFSNCIPAMNSDVAPTKIPYPTPKIAPTIISFTIRGKVLPTSTLPVANPRTIIVDDCVPIFPPIPIITGMKEAKTNISLIK